MNLTQFLKLNLKSISFYEYYFIYYLKLFLIFTFCISSRHGHGDLDLYEEYDSEDWEKLLGKNWKTGGVSVVSGEEIKEEVNSGEEDGKLDKGKRKEVNGQDKEKRKRKKKPTIFKNAKILLTTLTPKVRKRIAKKDYVPTTYEDTKVLLTTLSPKVRRRIAKKDYLPASYEDAKVLWKTLTPDVRRMIAKKDYKKNEEDKIFQIYLKALLLEAENLD